MSRSSTRVLLGALALFGALALLWVPASLARANDGPDAPLDAGGCSATARPVGSFGVGLLDGQLGDGQRACLRDEVALSEDAYVIARPEDFYGNIRLGTRISGSVIVRPELSLFANLEALRYQSLISAVDNTYLGLGYLALGALGRVFAQDGWSISTYGRLVLPSTTGLDQRSQPWALELGGAAEGALAANLRFHAFLSLIGSAVASSVAPADPRGGVRAAAGIDWVPSEAIAIAVQLTGGLGYRDALDFLAASIALRFAVGDVLGVELGGSYPFLGSEPALLAGHIAFSARFDGRGR